MAKENVTRIKIPKDSGKPKKEDKAAPVDAKTKAAPAQSAAKPKQSRRKRPSFGFLRSLLGYFVGAWHELGEVRWPNRRTTWSYTFAVIMFSVVMGLFIILLDLGLNELSRKVLSS